MLNRFRDATRVPFSLSPCQYILIEMNKAGLLSFPAEFLLGHLQRVAVHAVEGSLIGEDSIDGSANVSWSGSYTTSLAPGASVILTADGGPTGSSRWAATAGVHTLNATVDDINRFPESNENNNSLSVPLMISAGPPRLNAFPFITNDSFNFNFTATAGIQYQVQFKNELTNAQWLAFGTKLTANSNLVWISDPVTNGVQKFYRVLQSN